MKKKHSLLISTLYRCWKSKSFMKMRATVIILLICITQTFAVGGYSQNTRLSLNMTNATIKSVLIAIENQTDFYFIYEANSVDVNRKVTVSAENETIQQILDNLFTNTDISYKIDDRRIALTRIALSGVVQQQKTVSGKVTDSNGQPLPGVTVVVKGTTQGTITASEGNYSLTNVPGNATLVFSFVGMKAQEVAVLGKQQIDIVLEEETIGLEEVVAIGYGTIKKGDLTGAISTVATGTITNAGRTSVINAIQGTIPGVQIQQNSSRVGVDPSIIIRGQNSISGNLTPLYVVDGVVTNSIGFLNPQEIEKIDILKDASSTAIYGSRGANGVVLVETKSGQNVHKGSKPTIAYSGYYGITKMARLPHFMNSQKFMQYRTVSLQSITPDANSNGDMVFDKSLLYMVWAGNQNLNSEGQPLYQDGTFSGSQFLLNRYLNNQSTNWPDLVTKTGQQQNHYINISGSTENVSYVVGIGYQNEKGIFTRDNYNRYNLKGSVTTKLSDQWSVGFNFNSAYSDRQSGSSHAMLGAFRMSPIVVPYTNGNLDPELNALDGNLIIVPGKTTENVNDANGNHIYANSLGGGGFTSSLNPLVDLKSSSNKDRKITVLGNIYLQHRFSR